MSGLVLLPTEGSADPSARGWLGARVGACGRLPPSQDEDFLMIPQASCKGLVGVGGANIEKIEEESWATIEIDRAWRDTSKKMVMRISGGLEAVVQARGLVQELLARVPQAPPPAPPKRQPWKRQESWGEEPERAPSSHKRKWTPGADARDGGEAGGARRRASHTRLRGEVPTGDRAGCVRVAGGGRPSRGAAAARVVCRWRSARG
ncbi:unnamed protein product, partial [Prorocentrum cordatum]